ncbi:MAG: nucleotidyltransferase family protein [Candidatus Omnitrophota bacterium]|nr:nucleotidyltransferase family protein [Candidatus Omnitrophota bacterium]MBU1928852.1 nucleotidyltransferase family protein [Candidatus Omnitrophota bacterium]MBU2034462.1 nucleotidyltransferase family protein [Candidatus Omnitrophota bacterium]MBU2221754.1 nucleotidyltransferase family protein [Candidatus Omnitrophota bacterium]MBU2258778.1 nucleotidyltransferase family protein [Candidatus Omnitrophota bacterium]
MKALILAAGYGTRLYPYIKNYPKPLLEINQKPIIEYLVDKLKKLKGLSEVIIVTNDRFFKHFQKWRDGLDIKDRIKIINDYSRSPEEKLGAVKDMYLVFKQEGFDDDYIILGGDNFFRESLNRFVDFAAKKSPAVSIGVVDIKNRSEARNYGVVSLDKQGRITEFKEKPARPKSSLVATCIYYFPRDKVGLIKRCIDDSKVCFDNIGVYIDWLTKKDKVYGFIFRNLWVDIGRIETYDMLKEIMKGE